MSAGFITTWASLGTLTGAAVAVCYLRHAPLALPVLRAVRLAATLLTALAFGGLAWRFGYEFDLLPYSVIAGLGVMLGLIDLVEHRLPRVLVYSGVILVGALLATSAILDSRESDFLRALAGMAIIFVFYLILALASGGGLGAGDVKLGGLLGLALGWLSWTALITATFLGWIAAALAWLVLRAVWRRPRDSPLPMGPFLVLGTLVTVIVAPA
ncbi:prepilin peptidase [Kibdelosporangium persicum]|uniref:Leader peptidase (Prepilin peptidase) / N-methyltransferase n=1 Tax=Kibdelosporangium persicum TaxID=2698649 RepID=A0ABX2F4H7_9PSEU|nr:prepilin peptidase [Kibdelosporangium persicum]NRN65758.1 Leader peptidase (Prepilin peptidase) / N-methyltransferase [Kibdelosporangium persicum]